MTTPPWYIEPQQQVERVRQLNKNHNWGFAAINFPRIPESFTPNTSTEILMLNPLLPLRKGEPGLSRTVKAAWPHVATPKGHQKRCNPSLLNGGELFRSPEGYTYTPGITWVAFDYAAYERLLPDEAIEQAKHDGVRLAGTEMLMAAVLFPEWVDLLQEEKSEPAIYLNLLGIDLFQRSNRMVLYAKRFFSWAQPSEFRLDTYQPISDLEKRIGRSPTVREC